MGALKILLALMAGALAATVLLTGFPRLGAHEILTPVLATASGFVCGWLLILAYPARFGGAMLPTPEDLDRERTLEDAFRRAVDTEDRIHG